MYATSPRSRPAIARHASIADSRSGLRAGAGHSTAIATSAAPDASPQPARRSGIEEAGPASDTGRMNASSSEVEAPASTELTTPANSTQKATTAIVRAARTVERDVIVPRHTSAA